MGGGLMQLVAIGAQDVYLVGNPQITFFKTVYRRHTNFSMQCIQQHFDGAVDFGQKATCTVSRNGDLVHKTFLSVELPALDDPNSSWVRNVGHFMIKEVRIEIGGQLIDKHYGDWLNIWNELTQTAEKAAGYDRMIGAHLGSAGATLYIPLQFWFCRNKGLALPLIALQYHEVKITVEFRNAGECYVGTATTPHIKNASLYLDYIFLDTDERRKFAQSAHEYLIEQLQYSSEESSNVAHINSHLTFNHPCKELIWVFHTEDREKAKEWYDYSLDGNGQQPLDEATLLLNGHERFQKMKAEYFNLVQPYHHHTAVPSAGIYVYSFALHPEEHQPSGTLNMSRIDSATLVLSTRIQGSYKLRVYATNYNVLRIVSGMGGLSYSN
jgi:hypothetical protein